MVINGLTFCGYNAFSNTPISVEPVVDVAIQNAVFDVMHVSDLTLTPPYSAIEMDWDIDTFMHADFRGDAAAGNVDYAVYQASGLRIKRRRVGQTDWLTIRAIPVEKPEDFSFVLYDVLAMAETTYEYAIVPVINAIEGAIVAKTIDSAFDGVYIYDGNQAYHAVMDIALESSRIKPGTVVATLGSKYPYAVTNGNANYCEGSLKAFFLPIDNVSPSGHTTKGSIPYRRSLDDFLTNANAKILKDYLGRMWIVKTLNGVSEIEEGHPDHVLSSFNWTEIGDCENQEDLYVNGFVNVAGG